MEAILQFLRNLGTARLVMISVVGFLTFAFMGLMIGQFQNAPMTTLYAGLEQSDANEIIQQLEAQSIAYEIQNGGSSIAVPRDQVDRLRITLASSGLTGGVIGNEIFDRDSGFGRTTLELNFNRIRAIEGELTRTITSLSTVSSARIHIVLPERSPFAREANEPSASIVIRASGGLTSSLAQTIQAIVAGAIPGLSADRVAITDTSGRLLSDGQPDNQEMGFSTIDEARIARERYYTRQIESLLSSSLGAGNFDVSVALEMDMERETTSSKQYDPNSQVVLGQTLIEEESSEADRSRQAVTVGNNDPNANQDEDQNGLSLSSQNTKTEETTNFENSVTETVRVKEPGAITQMNIAVVVNRRQIPDPENPDILIAGAPREAADLQLLESLIKTAVPFVEDRSKNRVDQISVREMEFVRPPAIEDAAESTNIFGLNPDTILELVRGTGTVIVAVLFLMFVVRPIVMRVIEAIPDAPPPLDPNAVEATPQPEMPAITGPQDISQELVSRAAAGDEIAAQALSMAREQGLLDTSTLNTDGRIDVARVEGRIQESALKKVADIIKSNPEESVAIVRSWLYAE